MFCGFVKSIPIEIEEAAMIDGCTPIQTFFQVVFPIMKPTAITVAILQAMWIWNDYLLPYLVLDIKKYKTIPIVIQYLKGGYGAVDWGTMMAMLVLAIVPIVVFYVACQKSGYSISTVSRVLNHRNDVSPDAKKKIEEVVEKFHFVPNNNAKHLKQSNTKTIVVLVKGISNMLFSNIVEEIQQMIGRTDYTLVVSYIDEDENEVEQALQLCRERKPLGLLFLGGNPEFFKQGFAKVDVPSVLVTNRANNLPFENLSSVATDDIAAGKCAVDALLEAGHDKIGIIGGDPVKSYTSHQRYLGCKESFAEHGKEMDLEVCYEKARFSFDSAYRAMKRLVEKYPDLTAVFAMSDVMAIGAIRALRDMDYRVPEDISVIGFDGTVLAEYYNPKLATIRQQYQTLAVRSVEILFGQIELKKEPIYEVVPFEFASGESIKNLK